MSKIDQTSQINRQIQLASRPFGAPTQENFALVEVNKQFALIDASYKEVVAFGVYDKIEPMNFSGFSIVSNFIAIFV